jgi:probable F420-dependent oxidoreductase
MKVGVQVRATDRSVDLLWIARELEARGFESIFLPEHTHVPVSRSSQHPGGETLMDAAKRGLDPLIALTAVAAVTTRLRVGTGVLLLPQHDPILLAKQVSTLDRLSGGRVVLGVGAGWAREEMRNHGIDPARRWDALREKTLALKAIWTNEQAGFAGELVQFDPIWQWPKPAQSPHPPVMIGGEGPNVLDRVVAYGDGWIPNWEPDTLDRVAALNRMAEVAGRGPLPVTVYAAPFDPDVVAACAAAGVERICFNLPSDAVEHTTAMMDRIVGLVCGRAARE